MYVYCGNDPVNMYDPSGEAAIYVKTFIGEDIYTGKDGLSYKKGANALMIYNNIWSKEYGGSNVLYRIDGKQDFINSWNSLINASVVVINAHGSPESMTFGEEEFTTNDVGNLQYKTIKFVWLLSCNTVHYDYDENELLDIKILSKYLVSKGYVSYK